MYIYVHRNKLVSLRVHIQICVCILEYVYGSNEGVIAVCVMCVHIYIHSALAYSE